MALRLGDVGAGGAVELEECLDVGAVLVGQSLLVLVRPLADPALPSLCRVLVQHAGLGCGVLDKRTRRSGLKHGAVTKRELKGDTPAALTGSYSCLGILLQHVMIYPCSL